MAAILDAGYNIDYIDAATIDKLGAIPYPVLILPPTDRIPLATYKKIESYAAKNGKVIAIGKLPARGPGLMAQNTSAEIAALSERLFRGDGHAGIFVDSVGGLADALRRALPPDVDASGQVSNLGFIHRKLSGSDIYFVVNSSNRPIDGSIRFRSQRSAIESWDPDSDGILQAALHNNGAALPLVLAPYESRVFVLTGAPVAGTKKPDQLAPKSPAHGEEQLDDLSSDWQIHFAGSEPSQALDHLASWTELAGKQFYSGEAVYMRSVSINTAPKPGGRIFLDFGAGTPITDNRRPNASGMSALLDPPIREAAIIFVNGQRAGSLWHPPYRIDISKFAKSGENEIEVHVYNTAINLLAGQPPRDYTSLRAKYGRRFDPQDMDNLKPIPSGLFGPIHLVEQESK
jgi:hypothetical protein